MSLLTFELLIELLVKIADEMNEEGRKQLYVDRHLCRVIVDMLRSLTAGLVQCNLHFTYTVDKNC